MTRAHIAPIGTHQRRLDRLHREHTALLRAGVPWDAPERRRAERKIEEAMGVEPRLTEAEARRLLRWLA